MQIVYTVLSFIAGMGAFLFGVKCISECVNQFAGKKLTRSLGRLTNNRFKGVTFGFSFTTLLQSSSAMIALLVGFVGAGVLSFAQTVPIIFGANLGTVVTELLVSFEFFKISELIASFAGIGTFIYIFAKKDKTKNIAKIFIYLGIMFLGVKLMGQASEVLKNSEWFQGIIVKATNPALLILFGLLFTALIQSSLGSVVVLMSLASGGLITLYQISFFLFGINIGVTINAFLACIGSGVEGKRVAFTHFMFNIFGTIFFCIIMAFFRFDLLIPKFISNTSLQIVFVNFVFNALTMLILLPFTNIIAKMVKRIIKEKPKINVLSEFDIDDSILEIPSLALHKIYSLNIKILERMDIMIEDVINEFKKNNCTNSSLINEHRDYLNNATFKVNDYMTKIIAHEISGQEVAATNQIKLCSEFKSLTKHIYKLFEYLTKYLSLGKKEEIIQTIDKLYIKVNNIIDDGREVLSNLYNNNNNNLSDKVIRIIEEEEDLANIRTKVKKVQLTKIKKGKEISQNYNLYVSIVSELEEIGSKLAGIAIRNK